ncbi:hypothetical protein H6P81_015941 [Aristolochia fimbriata]|uniref:Uncharacterized protein n=1 Tax=Aristolochia fimbriata TaxID=158543 RepID=A0AAV7E9Y6_ARIFI|nr:hypothetical protein H6P81_015941 [Aristolochia fimbriata]
MFAGYFSGPDKSRGYRVEEGKEFVPGEREDGEIYGAASIVHEKQSQPFADVFSGKQPQNFKAARRQSSRTADEASSEDEPYDLDPTVLRLNHKVEKRS